MKSTTAIRDLYTKGRTAKQIAIIVGASTSTVQHEVKKLGIARPRGRTKQDWHGKLSNIRKEISKIESNYTVCTTECIPVFESQFGALYDALLFAEAYSRSHSMTLEVLRGTAAAAVYTNGRRWDSNWPSLEWHAQHLAGLWH